MSFTEKLKEIAGTEKVLINEKMERHTTFRIGGAADYFVRVDSPKRVLALISFLRGEGVPFFVLGNGSNLLVSDEGFRGVVLQTVSGLNTLETDKENGTIRAGAGVLLSEVVSAAAASCLDGMAFAAGIPGTVGGALVMNAGAYGAEMTDVVALADAIDLDLAEPSFVTLSHDELDFHYRGSIAEHRNLIFTSALFKLQQGDEAAIRKKMEELIAERKEKQPLEYPSAGSAFKRPKGQFAGKLIMEAGLQGFRIGGAEVSGKHCGFIVNRGGASASDVCRLMNEVREKVYAASGVMLEPEIRLLGEFQERRWT